MILADTKSCQDTSSLLKTHLFQYFLQTDRHTHTHRHERHCLTLAAHACLIWGNNQQTINSAYDQHLCANDPARVLQADSCPSREQRETTRSNINSDLDALLQDFVVPPLMPCGGLEWRRIAYVNTTESSTACPTGWGLSTVSNGKVVCGS